MRASPRYDEANSRPMCAQRGWDSAERGANEISSARGPASVLATERRLQLLPSRIEHRAPARRASPWQDECGKAGCPRSACAATRRRRAARSPPPPRHPALPTTARHRAREIYAHATRSRPQPSCRDDRESREQAHQRAWPACAFRRELDARKSGRSFFPSASERQHTRTESQKQPVGDSSVKARRAPHRAHRWLPPRNRHQTT